MSQKIDQDVQRFKEKVRESVKKNLKDFISDEYLIGRQGKKTIRIPLKNITIPHFTTGRRNGTGQGDGEIGDPIKGKPGKKPGKGAGDEEGDHPSAEFTKEELAQILAEELELPNIQDKGKSSTPTTYDKYNTISRSGVIQNRKRTYKEALKRELATGTITPDTADKFVVPIKPDYRFKAPITIIKPDIDVCVMFLRDYSGSVSVDMQQLIKSCCFWTDAFLTQQYKKIETRFFCHDTQCKEYTRDEFFTVSDGGGTRISSGYEIVGNVIKENPDKNFYLFQFSDGGNMGNDNELCMELIKGIIPNLNLFCYGQVSDDISYMEWLQANLKDEKFIHSMMTNTDEIIPTMKAFLGTGK